MAVGRDACAYSDKTAPKFKGGSRISGPRTHPLLLSHPHRAYRSKIPAEFHGPFAQTIFIRFLLLPVALTVLLTTQPFFLSSSFFFFHCDQPPRRICSSINPSRMARARQPLFVRVISRGGNVVIGSLKRSSMPG